MFSVEVKKIDPVKREIVVREVYEVYTSFAKVILKHNVANIQTDTQLKQAIEEEQRRVSLRDLGILELEEKEAKLNEDEYDEDEVEGETQ